MSDETEKVPEEPADKHPEEPSDELLGLEDFSQVDDDGGLSLESLSAAYAELIDRGSVPYARQETSEGEAEADDELEEEDSAEEEVSDQDCDISPRSILEAMLFVGNDENQSITGEQVASFMRGVRPQEVDELVAELNAEYAELGCPYEIATHGSGYSMSLRNAYGGLREKFYRRVRDARLSQAAIDVLAIVAYRQPLTRDEVDRLRGRPSAGMLTQLVRRQLLRIERPEESPRRPNYFTTDRFLQLFGLDNLNELPQSQDVERDF